MGCPAQLLGAGGTGLEVCSGASRGPVPQAVRQGLEAVFGPRGRRGVGHLARPPLAAGKQHGVEAGWSQFPGGCTVGHCGSLGPVA
eukprot:9663530-Lingulodinium_polyedra.AAC.1